MSDIVAPIDYLPPVLHQHGGIWSSAYHLIHPDGSLRAPYGSQFASLDNLGSGMKMWRDGTGTEWAHGAHAGLGLEFQSDCVGDLGCWAICDDEYTCQDPDAPTHTKEDDCAGDDVHRHHPTVITKRASCSTFGYEHMKDTYWSRVGGKLIRGRERAIECALAEGGDCVTENPFFSQPVDVNSPARFQVLGNGDPLSYSKALGALDNSLANCDTDQAGMIHAPTALAGKLIDDYGYLDVVDYGDGMGERSIHRTKARGNIIVSGSGYNGVGPNGVAAGENQAWLYATSMVYLVWDNVVFSPDENDFRSHFRDNRVDVVAEQIVGAFYSPCCNFAVLAELDACPPI